MKKYAKFFVSTAFSVLGTVAITLSWPWWAPIAIAFAGSVLVARVPNKKP